VSDLKSIYDRVYDVLVAHVGAENSQRLRSRFVGFHVELGVDPRVRRKTEYRFMGSLGMGGKFWSGLSRFDTFKVNCYLEEETSTKLASIHKANEVLRPLFEEYLALAKQVNA